MRRMSEAAKESARQRSRIYYAANRERSNAARRENARKNSEREIARRKERYARERTDAIAAAKQWQRDNPEKARARKRRWELNHPEYNNNKRAARMDTAEGLFTATDVKRLRASQGNGCAACRACLDDGYHIDHVMPLARGGSNWPDNLQLLCPPCNRRKSSKDPYVWAQEVGRLFV